MTGQDNSRDIRFANLNAKAREVRFTKAFSKRISRVCYLYHFYCVRIAADSGGTPPVTGPDNSRDIRFANLNAKSPRGTFYESFFQDINIKAPSLHFISIHIYTCIIKPYI